MPGSTVHRLARRGRRLSPGLALATLAGLLVLLWGCRERPAQLRPLDDAAVVLAFGDSLTYGTGAEPPASYPARLQKLIGRTVVNAGVPGEVTGEALARLPDLLDRHRPALVILCHGGNDLLRRLDPEQAAANLRAMVRLVRERDVDLVLIGVPEPGIILSPPDYYPDIAREFGLPYDGEIIADILLERSLKSDHIHPNDGGYALLADAVADLLRRFGAL